jgi:hypothetical protein
MSDRIKKLWYISKTEYCSVLKRLFAKTQMNLADIILGKISQMQKAKSCKKKKKTHRRRE